MALTSLEKTKIIQLLGYGAKTIQVGSVIFNKVLNDRLDNIPDDAETIVREYLAKIEKNEDQIASETARMGVIQIDDIKLTDSGALSVRGERKRWSKELALFLDIPMSGGGSGNMVSVVS